MVGSLIKMMNFIYLISTLLVIMGRNNCYEILCPSIFNGLWGKSFVYVVILMWFGDWKKEGLGGLRLIQVIVTFLMILLITMSWLISLCMVKVTRGIRGMGIP